MAAWPGSSLKKSAPGARKKSVRFVPTVGMPASVPVFRAKREAEEANGARALGSLRHVLYMGSAALLAVAAVTALTQTRVARRAGTSEAARGGIPSRRP